MRLATFLVAGVACRSEQHITPGTCPFVINEVVQDSRCDDRVEGRVDTGGDLPDVDEGCDNNDSPDWIELVNVNRGTEDLCDFQLRLDVAGDFPWRACDPGQQWIDCTGEEIERPETSLLVGGGDRIVLLADNHASWGLRHVSFDIPSGHSTLELWSPDGEDERLCDRVVITALHVNESLARFPDGDREGRFLRDCSPTRGAENKEACR